MLFFGDRGEFADMSKEQGATDEDLSRAIWVSDGDWTLACQPEDREPCEIVADRTGKKIEDGL